MGNLCLCLLAADVLCATPSLRHGSPHMFCNVKKGLSKVSGHGKYVLEFLHQAESLRLPPGDMPYRCKVHYKHTVPTLVLAAACP